MPFNFPSARRSRCLLLFEQGLPRRGWRVSRTCSPLGVSPKWNVFNGAQVFSHIKYGFLKNPSFCRTVNSENISDILSACFSVFSERTVWSFTCSMESVSSFENMLKTSQESQTQHEEWSSARFRRRLILLYHGHSRPFGISWYLISITLIGKNLLVGAKMWAEFHAP